MAKVVKVQIGAAGRIENTCPLPRQQRRCFSNRASIARVRSPGEYER